jgi:hypothetical protein
MPYSISRTTVLNPKQAPETRRSGGPGQPIAENLNGRRFKSYRPPSQHLPAHTDANDCHLIRVLPRKHRDTLEG